ncbi:putative FAD binding domain-containing protein [Rosellinia necatrix]|uniref:Putative FAD binding domain-containing protein n=1 Tax=Rosellinia necatrix TaxID=77044 RepID=A0A1W2TGS7_ROSNE|nr:putative FAD binding domain-containing protein [Rosellinia necatrix]
MLNTIPDLDVLVVGAGPSGTMLALELAEQGIKFRIIDKAPERCNTSRALIIQPRSFEVMNRHGDAHKLYEKGTLTSGPLAWLNNKPALDVDIRTVANYRDSEFSLPCLLSQADTESYLDECLKEKYGRSVERGTEATRIVQDEVGVSVTLHNRNKGIEEEIRAKYVVGADGAHSVVRKSSEVIKFEGGTYPQEFLMCDATIENLKLPTDRYHVILGTGLFALFPMVGGWARIMMSRERPWVPVPALDEISAAVARALPGGGAGRAVKALRAMPFRLHHYVASSYRDGRLFLVGDAAHIHSPVGGQGLNTAFQDALNLGWKLGHVLRGRVSPDLLDTFDAERRRVGLGLVATTDRVFRLVSMTNPLAVSLRNLILPWLAPFVLSRASLARIYGSLSQFGIHYREGPLVYHGRGGGGFAGPVRPGDRAPDGDMYSGGRMTRLHALLSRESYTVVLFSGTRRDGTEPAVLQRAADRCADRCADLNIVTVEQRRGGPRRYSHCLHSAYGFSAPGFVYVRPDAHVTAIGDLERLDEFLAWLVGADGEAAETGRARPESLLRGILSLTIIEFLDWAWCIYSLWCTLRFLANR